MTGPGFDFDHGGVVEIDMADGGSQAHEDTAGGEPSARDQRCVDDQHLARAGPPAVLPVGRAAMISAGSAAATAFSGGTEASRSPRARGKRWREPSSDGDIVQAPMARTLHGDARGGRSTPAAAHDLPGGRGEEARRTAEKAGGTIGAFARRRASGEEEDLSGVVPVRTKSGVGIGGRANSQSDPSAEGRCQGDFASLGAGRGAQALGRNHIGGEACRDRSAEAHGAEDGDCSAPTVRRRIRGKTRCAWPTVAHGVAEPQRQQACDDRGGGSVGLRAPGLSYGEMNTLKFTTRVEPGVDERAAGGHRAAPATSRPLSQSRSEGTPR